MTNNEFFETIYKPYQEQHMARSTSYTRCNIIENRLLKEYGYESPSGISHLMVENIYNEMESQQYAQNSIFGTYAALCSYFELAKEYREVEENPVRLARTIHPDKSY